MEVMAINDYLKEETLSSNYIYRGRIINVRQDRVRVRGGLITLREIVEHPGAVAVLALNENDEVYLVRQHRQPFNEVLLEIPAGKIEADEAPLECARRELLEETGIEARSWQATGVIYPSPGFCNEKIYLFAAAELTAANMPENDPDENIAVVKIPLHHAVALISEEKIRDAKTIIALQKMLLSRSFG